MRATGLAKIVLAGGCLAFGSGCGSDTPTPTPVPTTANTAPTITSPTTLSVEENTFGTLTTITVSDAEGGPYAFALSGQDAALFQIDSAGRLSFKDRLNFEVPTDANGDNIYNLTITATDPGQLSGSGDLSISVTDVTTGAFEVRRVSSAFNRPVYLAPIPDEEDRLVVVEKGGVIRRVDATDYSIAATPFLDVSAQTTTDGQRGLSTIAFSPDYATDRTAYVFMSNLDGDIEIRRYTAVADGSRLDPASADVIMRIEHSSSNINYGGWIGFDERKRFYITVGDANDCPNLTTRTGYRNCNAHARGSSALLGSVLRVDVSVDEFPDDPDRDYGISNPPPYGVNRYGSEYFLVGVRNPYRASIDRVIRTVDLNNNFRQYFWFGDIGQDTQEEISNIGTDQTVINDSNDLFNFGWPYSEGTYVKNFDIDNRGWTGPKVYYEHGTGATGQRAVVGGYFYYDGPVESLVNEYIFGDYVTGQVFSYNYPGNRPSNRPVEVARDRTADFQPTSGTIDNITSFGLDLDGNLYILDLDGDVFIVIPA